MAYQSDGPKWDSSYSTVDLDTRRIYFRAPNSLFRDAIKSGNTLSSPGSITIYPKEISGSGAGRAGNLGEEAMRVGTDVPLGTGRTAMMGWDSETLNFSSSVSCHGCR